MKLSLFSDYALRVLMFAALKGAPFQLDDVAEAYGISRNHLAKVVNSLSNLGYLATRRGRGGGIWLARPPEEIRVGQLVRQTEHQQPMLECFEAATNTCVLNGCCRLKGALAAALNAFYASLDAHSLRDLVDGPHRGALERSLLS